MIKAIIFDIGGVILDVRFEQVYRALGQHSTLDITKHRTPLFLNTLVADVQRGKLTLEQWHQKLVNEIHLTLSVQELKQLWLQIVHDPIASTIALLQPLSSRYELYLLSNIEAFSWPYIRKKVPTSLFKNIFLSYEIGHEKSEPETFQIVLNAINHKPDECLFIDDIAAYTTIAQKLGINTINYTKGINLKTALKRKGITI